MGMREGGITWGLGRGEEERPKALNGGLSKTHGLIACRWGRGWEWDGGWEWDRGGRRGWKGVSTSAAAKGAGFQLNMHRKSIE